MSTFNDREQAFETKFKMEEESRFKRDVQAVRMLAMWAINKAGTYGPAAMAYAAEAIDTDMEKPGIEDVLSKIHRDLVSRGVYHLSVQEMKRQFGILREDLEAVAREK